MIGLLALAATVAGSPSVGERLQVRWETVEGCPTEEAVRGAIDAYLGRAEFGPTLEAVEVAGRIEPVPRQRFRLHVTVRLPAGVVERRVDAARCDELTNAAGLMIAVALDPLRVTDSVAPREPPAPPPAPPPAARPPAPRRPGADLRLGGVFEAGTLPRVGGGARVAVAVVGNRFRVELAGEYWVPRTIRPFEAADGAGARVQVGVVGVRGCFVPTARRVELPVCVALNGGAMRAVGVGLETSRVSHRPWLAVVVGQEISWISRRRLGLWAGADALLNVMRPRFEVDDLGAVVAAGWAGFRLVAGPVVRF